MKPRSIRVVPAALLALVGLLLLAPQVRSEQPRGSFQRYTFSNTEGSWDYMLYVPSDARPNRPLMVYMPGALQTAEQAAYDTRWNELAERAGFYVLYPEANLEEGGFFHFMDENHQQRERGEPSGIAGMTRHVMSEWRIDPTRVYVGGTSNGAAMANVMAATYPDLYAALFAVAGCPYKGQCAAGSDQSESPEHSAAAIVAEMGDRARVMPFLVMQGSDDPAVDPVLSERTVQSWLLANDVIDNDIDDGSIGENRATTREGKVLPNGRRYTVTTYVDRAGRHVGDYWLIHGMRHAYPGGRPATTSGLAVDPASERKVSAAGVDPAAPDGTAFAYAFFLDHPMRPR